MITSEQRHKVNHNVYAALHKADPQIAAEVCIISAMLYAPAIAEKYVERLRPDDFTSAARRLVARCAKSELLLYGEVDADQLLQRANRRLRTPGINLLLLRECEAVAPMVTDTVVSRAVKWMLAQRRGRAAA